MRVRHKYFNAWGTAVETTLKQGQLAVKVDWDQKGQGRFLDRPIYLHNLVFRVPAGRRVVPAKAYDLTRYQKQAVEFLKAKASDFERQLWNAKGPDE